MKSLISLTALLVLSLSLNAQQVNIPDENFRYALIEEGVDTDDDGKISYSEAAEVKVLDISYNEIGSLTCVSVKVQV